MNSNIQLFVLPFSGGKAAQFSDFQKSFDEAVEVITIEYAGRGTRSKEPFFVDYDAFIEDVCNNILKRRDYAKKYAVLGYSIGGLFAYDIVSRSLLREEPIHLFIGACENCIDKREKLSNLPEEDFWNNIIALGGVNEKLLQEKRFLKLFSKALRADFYMGEQFKYSAKNKIVTCPTTILYCENDTPMSNIKKWQEVIYNKIKFKEFYGGHFFVLDYCEDVANTIESILCSVV